MYPNYSTPYLLLLVAVILFISLIENILRFELFGLETQHSDFIMIEQVFDISKLVLEEYNEPDMSIFIFYHDR